MKKELVVIGLLELVFAYEWLSAGWEKFTKPDFVDGISQTLGTFASKNPYDFYANFVNQFAIPNAVIFANLVRFSEIIVGLSLLLAAFWALRRERPTEMSLWVILVGLTLGFFLNINFYLASGWTGSSTAGINVIMGFVEAVLLAYYLLDGEKGRRRLRRTLKTS